MEEVHNRVLSAKTLSFSACCAQSSGSSLSWAFSGQFLTCASCDGHQVAYGSLHEVGWECLCLCHSSQKE